MRVRLLAAGAIVLLITATTIQAQRQLALLATVTDPNGAEVAAVNPEDVRILENDNPAKVLKVEPVDRTPKVQILIDNGIGMPQESIGDLRTGLRGLIQALPPNIEVTMVTTAPQPRFLERATTDRQKQLDAINKIAPDTGAGRFVESLFEATQRIERDKQQDAAYTIVTVGTSSGDSSVRERDMQQTMERIQKYRPVVHVTMLTQIGRSASGGVVQAELGQAVAQNSGGRYEGINVPNRLATLLPEIGAQMGKTLGAGSKQFRFTFERPGSASGDLGKLAMGVNGKLVSGVSVDRR